MCPNRPGRRRIPVADSTTFQGNLELALLSTPFPLSLLSVSLGRKFTHYLRSPSVGARGHSGTVARLRSPRSSTTTYTRLLCLSLSTPYLPFASLSLSLRALASFSPPSSPNSAVRRFRPSPREIPPPSRPPPPPPPSPLPAVPYPSRSTSTSSRRFPRHVASSSSLRVTPLSREACSPVSTRARSPSKISEISDWW